MQQDLEELQNRVAQTEAAMGGSIGELQEVLKRATDLLRRNSADLGAEVESQSKEQARLAGMMEETARKIDMLQNEMTSQHAAIDSRLTAVESGSGGRAQTSPEDDLADGKRALAARKYDEAMGLFESSIAKDRSGRVAPNAQYLRAQTFEKKKRYRDAIGHFQLVYEKYPKSDVADDALFSAGETAMQIKQCNDARAYFSILQKKYPRSKHRRKARARERSLKKSANNSKLCSQ